MVEAVKDGYPQREIADARFELQREIDSGRRVVVGVNAFTEGDDEQTPILKIDPALERKQIDRVQAVRAAPRRRRRRARAGRDQARRPPSRTRNLMPLLIDAARVHASEGEIVARAPGRLGLLQRGSRLLMSATAPAATRALGVAEVFTPGTPTRIAVAHRGALDTA